MFLILASTVRANSGKCMRNMLGEDPLDVYRASNAFRFLVTPVWWLWVFEPVFFEDLFEARPLMSS